MSMLSLRRDASRFAIAASTDTTVTFRQVEARWLKVGMSGRVVDPSQRDALIAQITIEHIDQNIGRATIVGAVSPVTAATHVILFEKPVKSWWRDKRFWIGAAAGAATGAVAASASK